MSEGVVFVKLLNPRNIGEYESKNLLFLSKFLQFNVLHLIILLTIV